jgi:hypothetical protein
MPSWMISIQGQPVGHWFQADTKSQAIVTAIKWVVGHLRVNKAHPPKSKEVHREKVESAG